MKISNEDMPFYNTKQAIRDINSFREAMGYTSWTIHAMSYGTQFTQHYATKYPKQVDAIVLDGAIDMKVNLLQYELDLVPRLNFVEPYLAS